MHYTEIVPPRATRAANNRVEVTEFFWYGCPHCFTLEPHLVLWNLTQGENIDFRPVPVPWRAERMVHARLYFALLALHRESLHGVAFDTIHRLQNRLDTFEKQSEFARRQGVSTQLFEQAYRSAAIDTELDRADKLAKGYRVAGIPYIAVNGKYAFDVRSAGSEARVVSLLTHLVSLERR